MTEEPLVADLESAENDASARDRPHPVGERLVISNEALNN
jgi:hypothetical protein